MKKYVFILMLTALSASAFSQSWYDASRAGQPLQGYVVTNEGDTLQGFIRYNYPPMMARRIAFKPEGGEWGRYKGDDLKGFYFMDAFWESHEFNDGSLKLKTRQKEYIFLRPILKGRLSVYEYYISEITDWVEAGEGNSVRILPTQMKMEVWLKKEGEDLIGLNNIKFLNFKKGMSKYLSDCASVAEDIEKKRLKRGNAMEAFRRYNECE